MDERIKHALDASKYRLNLVNSKENIKIKFDTMITYAVNGGMFKIDRSLLTFVKMIVDCNHTTVVLIDDYSNPIEIINVIDFYEKILDQYFIATNYYHCEYSKLKIARSPIQQFADIDKDAN